jgi:benzoylformate decarboxylase
MENGLTRREFVQALTALGVSAAGVASTVKSAEAAISGSIPGALATGRKVSGTGGDLMVEQMKAAGVKYLFTNPGSFEVGFFDAFLDQPCQLIMGMHEGIVISMADGYHKVTLDPAFVNVHVIAGTAQSAGQLYNSSRDGSALVVTAGLLDNERGDDNMLLAPRPGFDQKEVCRQFTKISWECHDAGGLPTMMRRAFKMATTDPGGPVYLAIPNHVLEKKNVSGTVYDREAFMISGDIPPNTSDIDAVAKLLLDAKSPALFVGDEVAKANAQPEAFELAELLRLPVGDGGLVAYRPFPTQHTLYGGGYSTRGKDVIIQAGVTDMGMGAASNDTKVICIGLNTNAIGSTQPFDLAIVANVKLALRALIDSVKAQATAERIKKIVADRTEPAIRKRKIDKDRLGMAPMHPDELAWTLEQELDDNAILVSENLSGSNGFYNLGFRDDEKTWIGTSGAGLGWGIGASTGAKIAAPDRQVVCNIGDGAVMYSAAGFWSQARYGVPVLTVVCNNENYQTVRNAYARYNGKMKESNRFTGMHLGDPSIDFAQLAKSQGCEGITVDSSADLKKAIRRGIDATREGTPCLINARVRCLGGGGDSTWHQAFNLAETRTRKV